MSGSKGINLGDWVTRGYRQQGVVDWGEWYLNIKELSGDKGLIKEMGGWW